MKCPKCNAVIRDEATQCRHCGTIFDRCPLCRIPAMPGSSTCAECGADLSSSAEVIRPGFTYGESLYDLNRYLPKALTDKIKTKKREIEGQKRTVTMVLVDTKSFTPLPANLGPEVSFSLMDRLHEIVIHKVCHYEGTVNELMGHMILAMFGTPIPVLDAPQRAIRSALAIHREIVEFKDLIGRRKQLPPILVRIGIHTGPVVVKTMEDDLRVELDSVGHTVRMASNLAAVAEPGTTYVTEDTFRLTEGLFRFEALGLQQLLDMMEPVRIYRVIGRTSTRTRFDVSTERGLTKLVGRERELELLTDGLERVKSGKGQAFSIVGEAGVGKSRLLYEFRKAVAADDIMFLEGKCLSYGRRTAYHPVVDLLQTGFDIHQADTDTEIRMKVTRALKELDLDEPSITPFVLELLSVKDSGVDMMSMSHEARRERIEESLRAILIRSAEVRPLVVAIEDLHWIDGSSEDVLTELMDSIPKHRVLLIFTYRPGHVHTWAAKPNHAQVALNRLSNRESLSMVANLVETDDIAEDLEQLILDKTGGVPFFIEELIRSLKDLGIVENKEKRYRLVGDPGGLRPASTIQDVILTRVRAVPDGPREVLQIGSVIDREFDHAVISKVTCLPEHELVSRLSILKYADLLYERGMHPESIYVFKHALIQEVCYGSLSEEQRREYHEKVARTIVEHFPERAESRPEVAARHFAEAGLEEEAVPYLQRAGEIAVRRSANMEAIAHLTTALRTLERLPQSEERTRQELDVQIALGPALMAARGYAAPEVEKAYSRARELCEKLDESDLLFMVLRGLWGYHIVRSELETAHELGEQCLDLAQKKGSQAFSLWAYYMLGMTIFHQGKLISGLDCFEQGIAVYDMQKRRIHRALQDPGVACLSYKAAALWLLGYPDRAMTTSLDAISLAQGLSHPFSIAYALNIAGLVSQLARRATEVRERAEAATALSAEHGIPYWMAWGPILRGWALAVTGEPEEGIKSQQLGMDAYTATGARLVRPYFFSTIADAHASAGNAREGLDAVNRGLETSEQTGDRWFDAELLRLKGELLLKTEPVDREQAESCFRQAVRTARRQEAKSLELRAAVSLGQLLQTLDKNEEANKIVHDIFGRFTEGFETRDLRAARALVGTGEQPREP